MAKSFSDLEAASNAVFLYLQNEMSVSDINARYEVNPLRLYEVIDGKAWHGALPIALNKLKIEEPEIFASLPKRGKLRREVFCEALKPLPLFE